MKQILLVLLFVVSLISAYMIQLQKGNLDSVREDFPIIGIYLFFGLFSLALATTIYIASKKERFQNKLGLIFIASVLLKPLLLIMLFRALFFSPISLSKNEAILLLIPLLVSLFFEVIFCAKLLSQANTKKKTFKG